MILLQNKTLNILFLFRISLYELINKFLLKHVFFIFLCFFLFFLATSSHRMSWIEAIEKDATSLVSLYFKVTGKNKTSQFECMEVG